jgi:hypothetical protein
MVIKNAKVPAEPHILPKARLRRTALSVTTWPQSVETWLRTIKILQAR